LTAPHFFVDPNEVERLGVGDRVTLSPDDSRHALRSLRLRDGDVVTVANNLGWVGKGRLTIGSGERGGVDIAEVEHVELATHPVVNLTMAPPKGDRLTWAVQKLAEVGVDAVVLVQTAQERNDEFNRWLIDRLAAADIVVNPRFGHFDPGSGSIAPVTSTAG